MAKEYELVGGQPVKVTPLEATDAGTYKAPHGQAYNPVTVPAGAGLPDVTSDDNGDILAVVSGAWAKSAPPSSLPSVTADDNGDVLTVVDGAWDKAAPSGGLPTVTADDNGDVLTVVDGAWGKAAPSGGSVLIVTITDDVADKTAGEIWAAIQNGPIYFNYMGKYYTLNCAEEERGYIFTIYTGTETISFSANTAEDYPVFL